MAGFVSPGQRIVSQTLSTTGDNYIIGGPKFAFNIIGRTNLRIPSGLTVNIYKTQDDPVTTTNWDLVGSSITNQSYPIEEMVSGIRVDWVSGSGVVRGTVMESGGGGGGTTNSPSVVTQGTYMFGEDPRNKIAVEEQFSSTRITTATTTVCLVGLGTLRSVFVEVALTGTVTIYDNTAGSGTIITILPIGTVGNVPLPRKCALGCTVVTSAADRLVVFTA